MEDEGLQESSVDLRNLETKFGMKTPEGLLRWLHTDVQDYDFLESEPFPGGLSAKIKTLKLEMRKLRSTDVKILQQLEALNEGMECMRWMWEERSSQTSLTSSQSGQNTTFISNNQTISDLNEDHYHKHPTPQEHAKLLECETAADSTPSMMRLDLQDVQILDKLAVKESQQTLLGLVERLHLQDSELPRLKGLQEMDLEPCLPNGELLVGYDVQWRWVESEDDVMFL